MRDIPAPWYDVAEGEFTFDLAVFDGPISLVVLQEDFRFVGRVDGIEQSVWPVADELLAGLEPGAVYIAYSEGTVAGQLRRSPSIAFWRH
ncbi:MAG TPA: hypothetical protein ENI87_09980 [bacterium]|nr:hypothetical protein [bacterium]